ncbi:VCBS repeat-containing protein [Bacillus toyonensis]|nr:VCBS repeat-containing protein [Bacillus toyonensis]
MYGWPVNQWMYIRNGVPFNMPFIQDSDPQIQRYNRWPVNGVIGTSGLHFPTPELYKNSYDDYNIIPRKKWPSFDAKQYTVNGTVAQGIAAADFDGDGNLDLAVTNLDSNNVSILLGNGNGTFAPAMNFDVRSVGSKISMVASGDFNGDGIIDLAITNGVYDINSPTTPHPPLPGYVSVLLGKGDGTFQAPKNYTVGLVPMFIIVSDFNHDGNFDLAVGNSWSETISILLGNGDGTFQPARDIPVGPIGLTQTPLGIAAADFNRDGVIDIAVANNSSGDISILLGNGDGTFQTARKIATQPGPTGVIAADFNKDGIVDLAVANDGTDNVSILLGNGDGTFKPAVNYKTGLLMLTLAAADLNGDGIVDLAVTSPWSNYITLFIGNGDGTFELENVHAGKIPETIVAADFNNDGRIDLAVACYNSDLVGNPLGPGYVSILLNKNC